jgi:hypothetical protein
MSLDIVNVSTQCWTIASMVHESTPVALATVSRMLYSGGHTCELTDAVRLCSILIRCRGQAMCRLIVTTLGKVVRYGMCARDTASNLHRIYRTAMAALHAMDNSSCVSAHHNASDDTDKRLLFDSCSPTIQDTEVRRISTKLTPSSDDTLSTDTDVGSGRYTNNNTSSSSRSSASTSTSSSSSSSSSSSRRSIRSSTRGSNSSSNNNKNNSTVMQPWRFPVIPHTPSQVVAVSNLTPESGLSEKHIDIEDDCGIDYNEVNGILNKVTLRVVRPSDVEKGERIQVARRGRKRGRAQKSLADERLYEVASRATRAVLATPMPIDNMGSFGVLVAQGGFGVTAIRETQCWDDNLANPYRCDDEWSTRMRKQFYVTKYPSDSTPVLSPVWMDEVLLQACGRVYSYIHNCYVILPPCSEEVCRGEIDRFSVHTKQGFRPSSWMTSTEYAALACHNVQPPTRKCVLCLRYQYSMMTILQWFPRMQWCGAKHWSIDFPCFNVLRDNRVKLTGLTMNTQSPMSAGTDEVAVHFASDQVVATSRTNANSNGNSTHRRVAYPEHAMTPSTVVGGGHVCPRLVKYSPLTLVPMQRTCPDGTLHMMFDQSLIWAKNHGVRAPREPPVYQNQPFTTLSDDSTRNNDNNDNNEHKQKEHTKGLNVPFSAPATVCEMRGTESTGIHSKATCTTNSSSVVNCEAESGTESRGREKKRQKLELHGHTVNMDVKKDKQKDKVDTMEVEHKEVEHKDLDEKKDKNPATKKKKKKKHSTTKANAPGNHRICMSTYCSFAGVECMATEFVLAVTGTTDNNMSMTQKILYKCIPQKMRDRKLLELCRAATGDALVCTLIGRLSKETIGGFVQVPDTQQQQWIASKPISGPHMGEQQNKVEVIRGVEPEVRQVQQDKPQQGGKKHKQPPVPGTWNWNTLLQYLSDSKQTDILVFVMRTWMVHMLDMHPTLHEVLMRYIDIPALRLGVYSLYVAMNVVYRRTPQGGGCTLQQLAEALRPGLGVTQIPRASITLLGSIHRRAKLTPDQLNFVACAIQTCQRESDVLGLLLCKQFQRCLGIGTDGARALLVIVTRYTHRSILCSVSHTKALLCHARRAWPHTMAVFDTVCTFWRSNLGVKLLSISLHARSIYQERVATNNTKHLLCCLDICTQCEAVYTCVQHHIGGDFKPQPAAMLDFSQIPPVAMCRHCIGVSLTTIDLTRCAVVTSKGFVYQLCTACEVRFVDTSIWFEACPLVLCLKCRHHS